MTSPAPRLWTPEDFATFASLTTDQVKKLRTSGNGPQYIKIGREIRYIPRKVEAWLQSAEQTSTKDSKERA